MPVDRYVRAPNVGHKFLEQLAYYMVSHKHTQYIPSINNIFAFRSNILFISSILQETPTYLHV